MASTFENNLRLEEIGTGEQSGTWGTKTNVNLELITDGLSYSSTGEAIANAAAHTITMADGVADEFRSFYLKCTGGGQACTVTLAPNTLSKVWVIENTTSYTLTFSQGSGANVAILAGQVKMIATDGAGSGAAVFDLMQDLAVPDLFVDDDLKLQSDGAVLGFGADNDVTLTHVADTGLLLNSTMAIQFNDASQFINAPSATVLDINATDEIELNATLVDINANLDVSGTITGTGTSVFASLDISGDIDVDGTTNLDVVDIDGAVQIDNTVTVGVDDTGYDVKFFGASASHFLLWDESADELVLAADSKLSFNDAAGGENIVASADGHLEVNAGTTLDVTAPTVQVNASSVFDVNGNINVSGTYTGGGLMTTGGNIVIPDAGNIGSASDTDAIAIASDGVVTLTQKLIGTELDISGDIDVDGTTNLDATNIVGDLTVTGDTATFTSTNAEDPLIIIKDTTNDANAARLRFVKDKGAAGADDDDIGTIEFFADNDAQEQTKFALIRAEVADASDGAEGGKLRLQIASHDGEMQNGLIITDGSAEDEIDVTIGNGTASVTTIAGALVSTGTVTASTGGSSTPSFTFSGDTNTGIFKSANDTIGFTTGGTERVQIGSFGVAADTLTNKTSSTSVTIDSAVDIILDADGGTLKFKDGGVHIANIGNSSSDLVIENKVQNKDIKFLGDDDGAGVTALTLDMSEAGDAAFNRNVSLAGTLTNSTSTGGFITLKRDDTTLTDNADVGAINFETTDSDDAGVAATILGSGDGAAGAMKLRFYTGTASSKVERLTIDKDGNVGIGTGSPQTTLHVRKDDTAVVGLKLQNNTTNGIMEYQVGNDADNWFFGIDASDRFGISDVTGQASQKLVITQSGNVGIGTSSPFSTSQILNTGWSSGAPYGTVLTVTGNNTNDANWGHLLISDSTTTTGNGGSLRFAVGATQSDLSPHAGIDGYTEGANYGGLKFLTRPNGGTSTERMRITSTGSVGINTISPATELDVQGTTTTNGLNLDAIAATISDTAVDIFVYDTRKDSDGGAWRKRTQGTSWYNETLNTATRGSRKEFPAVAVIVAESNQVTIYDGDDPVLPMWMVFNHNSVFDLLRNISQGHVSSTYALNGSIFVSNGNGNGLSSVSFLDDTGFFFNTSNKMVFNGSISQREDALNHTAIASTGIVNGTVNDVAMTVLPNAPIDAATGLPVPTIAVATDGGVSVIKDDGTVVDITGQLGGSETEDAWVTFDPDGNLFLGDRANSNGSFYPAGFTYNSLPSADIDIDDFTIGYGTSSSTAQPSLVKVLGQQVGLAGFAVGGSKGVTHLAHNYSNNLNNMVAYTTSSYNTGWMNGDIKLATLSDTDDTDVTGSELVTNGDFATDSDWTKDTGWSITGGQASFTSPDGTAAEIQQTITVAANTTYVLSWDVISTSMETRELYLHVGGNSSIQHYGYNTNIIPTGQSSYTYTTGSSETSLVIGFRVNSNVDTGDTLVIDNVSVRLAEEDRSVNGNGLQVFGTVTKNPVATGADLVAYSGFSTSNYLQQPYNSDLQFGTGDFVIMSWIKKTSGSTQGVITDTRSAASSNAGLSVEVLSNQILRLRTKNPSSEALTSTTGVIPTNTWTHFACVVSASGTNHKIYLNGKLDVSASVAAYSVNSSNPLWIGGAIGYSDVPLSDGSLALFRISATAPSPEQIKKIYEDEKFLFQENAQATLYGSSDAVTALAYDDDTELLHAGTSAGRSVFQGLRRVDNTTTAVGAAISASNGLVADE